jgi:CHAT domain-containing protein/tetratricopeptide (TPR) repeat protein
MTMELRDPVAPPAGAGATTDGGSAALAAALRAVELSAGDPGQARALAAAALLDGRTARDPAAVSVAYRALGLAARGHYDARTAADHLRRALRVARQHGLDTLAAEARMSLALVLDDLGRPSAAVREIDAASRSLRGLARARSMMQRALILRRIGRDDEAMHGYRSALRVFRAKGDRLWQARALNNRGVLHGYRGDYRLARADLLAAAAIYADLDLPVSAAQSHHNLGFVAAQAGDIPEALARYEQARVELSRTGPDAVGLLDLAELLQSAGLLPEARDAALAALDAGRQGRLDSVRGQAALLLASIALERGELSDARIAARLARRSFARQARPLLSARARAVELAAVVAAGRADRGTLRSLRTTADTFGQAGWLVPAWSAWLDLARVAVALGDLDTGADGLSRAAGAARRGPAWLRTRLWHVRAIASRATGDVAGALRSASAGLREFETHRASLGATELRVRGGAEIADLIRLRLRLALDHEPAERVLAWSGRCKAAATWLPPARPSRDPAIARDLTRLRRLHADLATGPASSVHTGRLLQRQRELESSVQRRAWLARGTDAPVEAPAVGAVAEALGDMALVDVIAVDDELYALVLVERRVHRVDLGRAEPVLRELADLRFALRRLVTRRGHANAALAAADHGAAALDRALIAPLGHLLRDRELVLTPTGQLHALPWPLLPSCRGRAIRVAPSSATWWRAERTPIPSGPSVFVGAPEPAHAGPEVTQIAAGSPDALVLAGAAACVRPVMAALDRARVGHIACHGQFRSDNPLFSSLRLADGPLTVYDLSDLTAAPGTLVLSGCDTGLAAVHPGEELLGLTSALLQLGTRTVVASTSPVDDAATCALMTRFHAGLRAGQDPAAALAAAQAATDDPVERASTASFVTFGAG